MRIVVDLTNSPHVPFFVPIIQRLSDSGHEVLITARRFAQTLELAQRAQLEVHEIGAHGGATRLGKARAAGQRTRALTQFVNRAHRERPIDLGISHGSTDLPLACRRYGIPHVTMFDYEWASTMHHLNCRMSWRVMTPDLIPPQRLERYGAAAKLVQYPGLKEEYYLADTTLNDNIRAELGLSASTVLVVLRPPPELALYHRGRANTLFTELLERMQAEPAVSVVVLARTAEQRLALAERHGGQTLADHPTDGANDGALLLPERALDGASLVAAADLVVSAGGTMNREAVALGTPVYTVFAGKMGAVDERLIADGRLQLLEDPAVIPLKQTTANRRPALRNPDDLVSLILHGLPARTNVRPHTAEAADHNATPAASSTPLQVHENLY